MKILLFSNNKKVIQSLTSLKKSADVTVIAYPSSELKKTLKTALYDVFLFVDIGSFSKAEQGKIVASLGKLEHCLYGIIDPTGSIQDPASLFHNGASDYIGRELIKSGLTTKRIQSALSFKKITLPEKPSAKDTPQYIVSGNDWKQIKSGHEYTFCFMFIELDNKPQIRRIYGGNKIYGFLSKFQNFIQSHVAPFHGKVWIWQDFGGLILFPFNGESCDAILSCARLFINRNIVSAEIFGIDILLSYRAILILGNTLYKARGDTGTIISDAINSIYHLGNKFAEPGNFYITEELSLFIPTGLEKLFVAAGDYDKRKMMRMLLPLYQS